MVRYVRLCCAMLCYVSCVDVLSYSGGRDRGAPEQRAGGPAVTFLLLIVLLITTTNDNSNNRNKYS